MEASIQAQGPGRPPGEPARPVNLDPVHSERQGSLIPRVACTAFAEAVLLRLLISAREGRLHRIC
jgi:hypothetical protein